jgi:hypothetical protein
MTEPIAEDQVTAGVTILVVDLLPRRGRQDEASGRL